LRSPGQSTAAPVASQSPPGTPESPQAPDAQRCCAPRLPLAAAHESKRKRATRWCTNNIISATNLTCEGLKASQSPLDSVSSAKAMYTRLGQARHEAAIERRENGSRPFCTCNTWVSRTSSDSVPGSAATLHDPRAMGTTQVEHGGCCKHDNQMRVPSKSSGVGTPVL
jgi:hypothetical protein